MSKSGVTQFTGYKELESETKIEGLLVNGLDSQSAKAGDEVEVVLSRTSFYAESGGQLADHGLIKISNGALVEISDVQTPVPGLFVHRGKVKSGEFNVGLAATSAVDSDRRMAISRAHTATHMVHKAFREALGETATQMGSENSPGRFRFDFPSPGAVPQSVLADVEARVNDVLIQDLLVNAQLMTQDEARKTGAMALFGEKYGDEVRVISIGDWAKELCGGTHTQSTGQLGVVTFLSESSIGAGVRRVEALVGSDAYRYLAREHFIVDQLAALVKVRSEELPERIGSLLEKLKDAERQIAKAKSAALLDKLDDLVGLPTVENQINVYRFIAPLGTESAQLRDLVMSAKQKIKTTGNVMVGIVQETDKVSVVVSIDSVAKSAGLSANGILTEVMVPLNGRGGGSADLAQGGGTNVDGINQAFELVLESVRANSR
jgi:alanyl-tRNA synthetase